VTKNRGGMMERIRRIKGTDRGIRKVTTETKGTKPKSNINIKNDNH
jgi:hypothetical protein